MTTPWKNRLWLLGFTVAFLTFCVDGGFEKTLDAHYEAEARSRMLHLHCENESSEEVASGFPFWSLFFSRDVDRRSADTFPGTSLGSEFLGKRRKRVSEFLGKRVPGSEFLGKRVPGSEFLGKRVPGSEFLGKRVPGSEFLGKRVPGSEFLGKRVPGSEFLGKRVPGSEFLGKRVPGSEFLGKRSPEIPVAMGQSDRDLYWGKVREAMARGRQ